jgi:hypothetical protein
MTPDELDGILSSEDLLEPSSQFAMEAMAAIRRQASQPPPLRFPWFRFVAGLAASGVTAVAGTVLLLRSTRALPAIAVPLAQLAGVSPEVGYATAAVLVSLGLASLPRCLPSPEGDLRELDASGQV